MVSPSLPRVFHSQSPAVQGATAPTINAQLLGSFHVLLDEQPVESWPSRRGRAIFKYLLSHRRRPTPRDVLMDLFWPDAAPEAARNSLNVAIYGLRQVLQASGGAPVVIYRRQEATYRLNPEFEVWLDVDEFERQIEGGRRLEAQGQLEGATTAYEQAISLYQGDFLADDLYEEWPAAERERLLLVFLDALERLSRIAFDQARYTACALLCRQILNRDGCREDAHCRLMHCYSRQGQHHLALRQYKECTRLLADELGIAPAPATTLLYRRLLQREQV